MSEASAPAPVAVLIDELRNPDLQIRLNSFRQLSLIGQALGPQRTRDELVPYLHEFIDDDDDEVLLVLSEELAGLVSHVGGVEHAHVLFAPLELLAGVEEQSVRSKAVESTVAICAELPDASIVEHMVPVCTRLANMDWFTSRVSACNLCTAAYKRVPADTQAELRKIFTKLCSDETPMVRREACSCIGKFVNQLESKDTESMIASMTKLAQDDQDSVRLLSPQMCIEFLTVSKDNIDAIYPVVLSLCRDKSWRVRWMAADKFHEVCTVFKTAENEAWMSELVQCFVALLQDSEAEVRTAATFKLDVVAKLFPQDKASLLLPAVQALAKDTCQYARAALGSVVMGISEVIPRQEVLEQLLPIVLQLLKDSDAEVRLNIISKLDTVGEVIGMEMLTQSLLPAIGELSTDDKWRVRLAIMEHVPRLATRLSPEFFEQKLCEQCVTWMGDLVFTVRRAACRTVTELVQVYGKEWGAKHIIPKVVDLSTHKSCSYRLTATLALRDLVEKNCAPDTFQLILPHILTLCNDPVANVRFNVAQTLQIALSVSTPEDRKAKLTPALEKLLKDTDPDVRYFSEEAMEALKALDG